MEHRTVKLTDSVCLSVWVKLTGYVEMCIILRKRGREEEREREREEKNGKGRKRREEEEGGRE